MTKCILHSNKAKYCNECANEMLSCAKDKAREEGRVAFLNSDEFRTLVSQAKQDGLAEGEEKTLEKLIDSMGKADWCIIPQKDFISFNKWYDENIEKRLEKLKEGELK